MPLPQGYKDFAAGAVLQSDDLEGYCQNQTTMRFADATARDSALSAVKTEGMRAYLISTNTETIYSGSAWSTIGPLHGALTSFTPVITQSGSVTFTTNNSTWQRVGRMVTWRWTLTVTGTGSASNLVTLSLPVNINYVGDHGPCGAFHIIKSSTGAVYGGPATPAAAGTIKGYNGYPTGITVLTFLGLAGFTAALVAGDTLSGWVTYEAAADG